MRPNTVRFGFPLLLMVSTGFCATTTYTNLSSFVANTGTNSVATFDDVSVGTINPTSNGVAFTGSNSATSVVNNVVNQPHSFWFPGIGSSPNWLFTITNTPNVLTVTFPSNVTAFGFLFTCFACESLANDAQMRWTLLSDSGTPVGSGSSVYNFGAGFTYATPNFLGVQSSVSFKSVQIVRMNVSTQLASGGVWFLDDLRYAQGPPPSVLSTSLSQIVDGGGWNTRFVIINTDQVPVTFTFKFWDAFGNALQFPIINGTPGVLSGTLAPGASYFAQSPGTATTLQEGSADVVSSGKIGVTALYQFSVGSPRDSLASAIAAQSSSNILMPFDNTQGNVTAIAIANTNPIQSLMVSMLFETVDGTLSTSSIQLSPHAHTTFVAPVINPAVAGTRGAVRFAATSPYIAVMGFEFTSAGAFTSLGAFQ